ncbi:MAG: GNAT family N-acetyltransferase [Candidatus Dormiibacterota bacterium]
MVTRWLDQFHPEANPGRPGEPVASVVERRLAARQLWLWWEGATPVALAGRSATASGIALVGPVYTPPEHRRHGFGAAVTAVATQAALDAGATHVVLYTDLANPTSNSIYQAVGYVPDHDAEDRRLVAH